MFNFSAFPLLTARTRLLLAILLLAMRLPVAAQTQAWQSARVVAAATAAAASNTSAVEATAVDAAGNVYLAGNFTNSVVLGGTTLTSLGGFDIFVAKFNPTSNQFEWAQRVGGTSDELTTTLAVSGTSVYVAGRFTSPTVSFGITTLTSVGSSDLFVAKLTDMGSFVWAQQAGGIGDDIPTALAVSGTSVYVAGYFYSLTASFGATTLTNADANRGLTDLFVAKLTDEGSTGSFVWAQRAGGPSLDYAVALAVNGTSVYMAGYFSSLTISFGATTLTNADASTNFADVFVVKLTDAGSTGSFVWAQRAGGLGEDISTALVVSGSSVYVAGFFHSSTVNFGAATLTNAGNLDIFVAKLTDTGSTSSFEWAQRAGGLGRDYAAALAVSGTNVYMAGSCGSPTAAFGPFTLVSAGYADVFVARLTDAGSFAWAQRAGGTGVDVATSVSVSGTSIHVAGYFNSSMANFGATTISDPAPTNSTFLGYLASLTDATLTATTTAAGPRAPAALFPNPAHHTATLRLPAGAARTALTLTDALGRTVRHYPAPAGPEAALDLRGLPAGLYLLRGAGPAQRLLVE